MDKKEMSLGDIPIRVSSEIKLGTLLDRVNSKLKKAGYKILVVKQEQQVEQDES